ncbi:MAG: hypothetical protein CME71_10380 [Halobacteriovorax sp.]|nr:hypothetical protein [Halobacteriovorax sp.]
MAMSREDINNYARTSSAKKIKVFGELTWTKLIFLGLIAALFSYGPLSLFAPVPLALGILLYGRLKTFVVTLAFAAISVALQPVLPQATWMSISLGISLLFAALISEIVLRRRAPVQGLILTGTALVCAVVGFSAFAVWISGMDLSSEVTASVTTLFQSVREQNAEILSGGGEESRVLADFLSNPQAFANDIMTWSLSFLFVGVHFTLWVGMFMILRNSLVWRIRHAYPYGLKDLVRYKVPDFFAWPLISGLALYVGGTSIAPWAEAVGGNLLACLGVFFFFQGFGVFLDLLSFLGIRGFFRSLLVISTVFMGWKVLVVAGLFDLWVDFRRFMKTKKNDEGDSL